MLSGHGIGLRPKHFTELLAQPPAVDFLEANSENFMAKGGRPLAVLDKVRAEVPVALHGVSLSIGSVEPLDRRYLSELRALIDRVQPAAVSDHLCWGRHGARYVHDLWPMPFTEEAVAHVAARVSEVQDALGRQFLLENVSSYVTSPASTMSEWEFISEVCRRGGCGLLLDVNNVYVSSVNHLFDPRTYLRGLPASAIGYIHLAGHQDKGGWLLDSHDAPVPDTVWELYRDAVALFGALPTVIEWDDQIPTLEVLVAESEKARAVAQS
jgi:uncharacterized protein (UPF0276 family)